MLLLSAPLHLPTVFSPLFGYNAGECTESEKSAREVRSIHV